MALPRLQRSTPPLPVGIVHLGPGAFCRAHTMTYLSDAMEPADMAWGVCAVSLTSRKTIDQLVPQGGAYTAVELRPDDRRSRVIEVISRALAFRDHRREVMAQLVDPMTRIVSLTITEKGYALPAAPEDNTAPEILAQALAMRRLAGHRPFTVLSCDNLSGNGEVMRDLVLGQCARHEPGLVDWVANEGRFPCTMVDRITPATTGADIDDLERRSGYRDEACVVHEPFGQWIIEDRFVDAARPALERAGVLMVDDVSPHEVMKLRCLNAAHSAIAYIARAMGHETIAQSMGDRDIARFIDALWERDILATLPPTPGIDSRAYCRTLRDRFANRGVHHRLSQIGADGSAKLGQRIFPTMVANIRAGRGSEGLCLVVAAWIDSIRTLDRIGPDAAFADPRAAELRKILSHDSSDEACVEGLLALQDLVPGEIAGHGPTRQALVGYLRALRSGTMRDVVLQCLRSS